MLKAGENVLSFPSGSPDIDLTPLLRLKARPGEFFAVLDPPRTKTEGGIMLRVLGDGWNDRHTESVELAERDWERKSLEAAARIEQYKKDPRSSRAKQLAFMASEVAMAAYAWLQKVQNPEPPGAALEERPDSYTVATAGEGVPLSTGDRVMIAPYAARRFQFLEGVPDVVLVGREDPWQDITVLLLNQLTKAWEPLDNWLAIKIAKKSLGVETVRKKYVNQGTILSAGPSATFSEGEQVALHRDRVVHRPDNTKWFEMKYGPWKETLMVRETDSDGVRRVLASID